MSVDLDDRYQNQPWYVRLYRRVRYQWSIPLVALRIWWHQRKPSDDDDAWTFRNCWGLAIGLSQVKMNYVYTWDEVKGRLDIED